MTGRIRLSGIDVLALNEKELEELRWRKISVVFQGAMNALNPVQRIGDQLLEPIHLHEKETSTTEGRGRVTELLEAVGIPGDRARDYPHELSGGMRQRVMIAMALGVPAAAGAGRRAHHRARRHDTGADPHAAARPPRARWDCR